MDYKLNMRQQCGCEASGQQHPGLHQEKRCQQAKGGDYFPLPSTGATTFRVLCPLLGSSVQDREILEQVQQRPTKMISELEHLTY